MRVIHAEDECNDTYGRIRMYQALLLKNPTGIKIPSERTVYRVMDEIRTCPSVKAQAKWHYQG